MHAEAIARRNAAQGSETLGERQKQNKCQPAKKNSTKRGVSFSKRRIAKHRDA